jgi:hypothetical protein
MSDFAAAVVQVLEGNDAPENEGWTFHAAGETVIDTLLSARAEVVSNEPQGYLFIALQ